MDFFIDSVDIDEIKQANGWGIIDGVTTNPSLIAQQNMASGKAGESGSVSEVIREIASIVDGPISAEVIATDAAGMIAEGKNFARIHDNVTIKLPMTEEGIKALKWFSSEQIKTNITLVFFTYPGTYCGQKWCNLCLSFHWPA